MNVSDIFETMEYGPAPEDASEVRKWLAEHGEFGHFIGGKWVEGQSHFASFNPATGEELGQIAQGGEAEIDQAVNAARKAQPAWAKDAKFRARKLYALARHIQKHARFLAVLETLDNGKPIRESRDADIPLAARHFYHHAGWAQIMHDEFEWLEPLGVVGQIIPWNFPFLMLAWKIAPALAAGNTVILKPAEQTSLTALYFAMICEEIGLPEGVVNIVTGDGQAGAALVDAKVDKIAFTGSTDVGRKIQAATAPRGLPLTLELGGKSPFVVFEDADLDAAVEGIVNAIWYNQGEVCCAGSRLLAQASIADALYEKLKARMKTLRMGDPLDKSIDVGALVDQTQLERVTSLVKAGEAEGGEVFQASQAPSGCFFPPTLITNVESSDILAQEEIFGPVLVAMSFRTEKEAVALANDTRYGLAASLWSENLDQCLSVAPQLRAGVVWINTHNQFDAAAPFGGVKESGFGREGGYVGMLDYLQPTPQSRKPQALKIKKAPQEADVDITRKFYIGGKQARPDGGYSEAILGADGKLIDLVGIGNRKDIRNAAEAARASSWRKASGHNRAQVLYYFGENLERRRAEFVTTLRPILSENDAQAEVYAAVDACFEFAAWADKNKGNLGDVPQRAVNLAMNEPVGVIGILPHGQDLLAAPVRAMAAALSMGNSVVLCAPESFPLAALDLGLVAENSDLPAGAFNVLSGDTLTLADPLFRHAGVEAVWDFYGMGELRAEAAGNIKRVLTGDASTLPTRALLHAACEVKSIWLPFGALY